jgi:hypothetical protein
MLQMIARQAMVDIQIIHYIPFADPSQFSAASHRTLLIHYIHEVDSN